MCWSLSCGSISTFRCAFVGPAEAGAPLDVAGSARLALAGGEGVRCGSGGAGHGRAVLAQLHHALAAESRFPADFPAAVGLRALFVSSLVFGLEHSLWFAGLLAGLAYGWLYRRSGNLWWLILAHGLTNFILGLG